MKISKRDAFLAAYRITASVTKSAIAAGVTRHVHYDWLDKEDYAAAFASAQQEAAQMLEDEAVDVAIKGVREPLVHKGEFCYEQIQDAETGEWTRGKQLFIRNRSVPMHIVLLKRFMPEKYRDNFKAEISGPNGGPIAIDANLAKLTDADLEQLISIAKILATPSDA